MEKIFEYKTSERMKEILVILGRRGCEVKHQIHTISQEYLDVAFQMGKDFDL